MDITALGAALTSLKHIKDLTQAMIGLRDAQAIQAKTIEFQSAIIDAQNSILSAQQERSALLERIGDLEKEMTSLKAWETEKERYELKQLSPGTLAYVIKENVRQGEPVHCICGRCYEDGKKSILHVAKGLYGQVHIRCPRCQVVITGNSEDDTFPVGIC